MSLARYDAFEHLYDAPFLTRDTLVASLAAYFDEAGTDASKPAVAVACYVATAVQWKCFNVDWHWLRDWSGVKKYFHRTDQESFWLHDVQNTGTKTNERLSIRHSMLLFMPIR
jgi:hypothetical protein